MIAYKGFNSDLTCTKGKGSFKYEVGETYEEEKAQCANTGFHCCEEPIEVLTWYNNAKDRYCIVNAMGDIHEDGRDKISCSKMKILKEITIEQLAALESKWIMEHPTRENSKHVCHDKGYAQGKVLVVRGKRPIAAGHKGATLFLLKENDMKEIIHALVLEVDGIKILENTYYDSEGRVINDKE